MEEKINNSLEGERTLSVIVPARDEEGNIGEVIDKIRESAPRAEIIVVDNNSRDRTAQIAKEKSVLVIREEAMGKGNAARAGARAAHGRILAFIDGDGEYDPDVLLYLAAPIRDGTYDLVYGSRFLAGSTRNGMTLPRTIGNKTLTFLASLLYQHTSDLLTGTFAIKKEKFRALNLQSKGFEIETEIFTKAVKRNFRIGEVPCAYASKKESRLNIFIDGLKILRVLLRQKIC